MYFFKSYQVRNGAEFRVCFAAALPCCLWLQCLNVVLGLLLSRLRTDPYFVLGLPLCSVSCLFPAVLFFICFLFFFPFFFLYFLLPACLPAYRTARTRILPPARVSSYKTVPRDHVPRPL